MRNLKKAGAVALAAVMAVTFAPVASLNAFAADTDNVTTTNGKITAGGQIVKNGTYTIDPSSSDNNITVREGVEATIDVENENLSGFTVNVNNGATLTVIDSRTASQTEIDEGTLPTINVGSKNNDAGTALTTFRYTDPATLIVKGGHVTTVNAIYGDTLIEGGFVGTFESDGTSNGVNVTGQDSDGKNNTDNRLASSLDVKGGYVDTITINSGTNGAKELMGAIKFEAGNFGTDITEALAYSKTDNTVTAADVKGITDDSVVASFTSVSNLSASTVYAVGNETIAADIAANAKAGASSTIEALKGATSIEKAPSGTTATISVATKRGETEKQTLTVTPADDTSMVKYTEKSPASAKINYTTKTTYAVGDNAVATYLDSDGAVKDGAEFVNGGNTLEVEVDGKTYVSDEKKIEHAVATGTAVKVVNLPKSLRGKIRSAVFGDATYDLTDATTFEADPKYTIVSSYGDDGRHVVVTEATSVAIEQENAVYQTLKSYTYNDDGTAQSATANKAIADSEFEEKEGDYAYGGTFSSVDDQNATTEGTSGQAGYKRYIKVTNTLTGEDGYGTADENDGQNVSKLVVEQVGTTHGFVVLTTVPSKAKVSTKDTTVPVAFTDNYYYVGEGAIQYAVQSKEGKAIGAKYTVAKTYIPSGTVYTVNGRTIYDKITFIQGGLTMHNVGAGDDANQIDKEETWITFLDGANLGISKKWNYSTSAYSGVKMITSADVTVGGAKDVEPVTLYRIYNSITGEHFYTTSKDEVDAAIAANVGWSDETPAEGALKVLPKETDAGVTVYRIHNTITGEHLFSTSKTEIADALAANVGWEDEGVAFKGAENGTSVYRLVLPMNNNTHLFTSSDKEIKECLESPFGWKNEGVSFYSFQ